MLTMLCREHLAWGATHLRPLSEGFSHSWRCSVRAGRCFRPRAQMMMDAPPPLKGSRCLKEGHQRAHLAHAMHWAVPDTQQQPRTPYPEPHRFEPSSPDLSFA
ncbi:hypothetical protein NDU88_001742 [Pleurodeles waltl]|uniref:Uncharacterized protein n=1 Tax=Pleurodeles waltl TaxID=8319 RepID=A0AAV7UW81_PLEWA|nr:hypothetical protein NDU88_001742 [Pleurodeles waltl]